MANADAHTAIIRGTESPLDAYNSSLPKTLDEVRERLQQIEVTGIHRLEDGLVSATVKALGLKGALGEIAGELLHLALQLAQSNKGGAGGILGLLGKLGSLFGGGSKLGPAEVQVTDPGALSPNFALPHFATGGIMDIGGFGGIDQNTLSMNGSPIARVSRGERLAVIPQASNVNVPSAGQGGGGSHTTIVMNGVITNEQFWSELDRRSHVSIAVAAQAGALGGQNLIVQRQSRAIP